MTHRDPTQPPPGAPDPLPGIPEGIDYEALAKVAYLARYGKQHDDLFARDIWGKEVCRQQAEAVIAELLRQLAARGCRIAGPDEAVVDRRAARQVCDYLRRQPVLPRDIINAKDRILGDLAAMGDDEDRGPVAECDHAGNWIQRPQDSRDGRGAVICPKCGKRSPLYPEVTPDDR